MIFAILSIFIFNGNTGCGSGYSYSHHPFIKPEKEDFSALSWTQAYDSLHELLQQQYAFGEWKNIDWVSLNNTIRPKIVLAEAGGNADDYITALLEYTRSTPDGHVTWEPDEIDLIMKNTNGTYGLGIIGLDDGKVIANVLTTGGPADIAGIDLGAEITQWDGVPISTAVTQTSTLWRPEPASIATNEHTTLEQYRALALDPVGAVSNVTYMKSDGTGAFVAALTATYDNGTILRKTAPWNKINPFEPIKYEVLSSGYGYIQLGTLESPIISTDQLYNKFKEAMEFLTEKNVPGLIIDLRGNGGGSDELAARISVFFYKDIFFMNTRTFTMPTLVNARSCSQALMTLT
ncbi:S41 family peptidase [Maridesulfovibrio sp.]|uniref:S41 family peptidase n=1 Tax=Maridesulfovibrio sp. TaxID=2795000 RepID=UPI003BAC8EB1